MEDFYNPVFFRKTLYQIKSELDSLHINLKVISSNDIISQNQLENRLIKIAKDREEYKVQKIKSEWENKFFNLFYFDNLFAVKVAQYSVEEFEKLDSSGQFIA